MDHYITSPKWINEELKDKIILSAKPEGNRLKLETSGLNRTHKQTYWIVINRKGELDLEY